MPWHLWVNAPPSLGWVLHASHTLPSAIASFDWKMVTQAAGQAQEEPIHSISCESQAFNPRKTRLGIPDWGGIGVQGDQERHNNKTVLSLILIDLDFEEWEGVFWQVRLERACWWQGRHLAQKHRSSGLPSAFREWWVIWWSSKEIHGGMGAAYVAR